MPMFKKLFLLLGVIFIMQSCVSKKDIHYYQDIEKTSQTAINYVSSEVQVNDILYIKIDALVPDSAKPFNIDINSAMSFDLDAFKVQSFLVAQDGTITFPILGVIKVAGKSTTDLQILFSKMLNDKGYIRDANVNIRVINSKVTVIGEVNRPGTYSFSEQNISLNQAIGYAGDLTINGKRKDVLLIRENNGIRTYTKLDLTSSSWFSGPYYYVKQNDVIIVNPNGARVLASGYFSNITNILAVLSFGISLAILITK